MDTLFRERLAGRLMLTGILTFVAGLVVAILPEKE